MKSRIGLALVLTVLLAGAVAAPAWERADLSRLVVVGDSLSAGMQNGSLHAALQVHGYASVVAAQAGVELPLPLIAPPGIPTALTLVDPGPPPILGLEPGISVGRLDPTVQPMNLAVPGARVQDALATRPGIPIDSLTDLVLGLPGLFGGVSRSQVEWAEVLAPTTIIVWLGNNDALEAALAADASLLTPLGDFEAAYVEVMDRLAATGATLVVANIPDVTVVPFLTPAEDVAALVGLPLPVVQAFLGIGPGDFVTPDAFPLIGAILGGFLPGPLPGSVVLDAGEVAVIRERVAAFNAVIAAEAAAKGAALVDAHGLLERVQSRGFVVGGQRLGTGFLGGLFSLDGVHPTNTGHAVLANEFIRALNTRDAARVPPVSVRQVQEADPLVLPGIGHPATALGQVAPDVAETIRATLSRREVRR